ncbi:PilC/PilY family type IV pilus protein [Luteimonas sp. MC1825]|uniref:pilus assembly protein n=1 Tax=Luteimonas sp. MC1825 TaxID=2761107 RepID=UPI0016085C50|nr:PilC/PilY family type IV pilus protein [Luteimonas sp. MC1825]MBB6598680.1 fimbrial protein [Luteimonas sp. MC1825]QOC88852.1 fimbrial protein [Luteimonas sp. MC1825]
MNHTHLIRFGLVGLMAAALLVPSATVKSDPVFFAGTPPKISQVPLYLKDAVPPLNMLVMGKDHKLYYEAYNDASDLDGDGVLDIGYRGYLEKPGTVPEDQSKYHIDYYGYFNSYACYTYSSGKFTPVARTDTKKCTGQWSGDYLNYLTTSRIDALRKVLYGGKRSADPNSAGTVAGGANVVLERAYIPQDAHTWGKEYKSEARDGYKINDYTPYSAPTGSNYHLFASTTLTEGGSPLLRALRDTNARVWEWVSIERPVAGTQCTPNGNQGNCRGTLTDFTVRVDVCPKDVALREANCKVYPDGSVRPTGILHTFGETDRMSFGLMTGTYSNNTQGGVLRKNMGSFRDEIDAPSGKFVIPASGSGSIVANINGLGIYGFTYNTHTYTRSCPGYGINVATGVIKDGECWDWGNPIAEIMYEGLRYFNGRTSPTAAYANVASGGATTAKNMEDAAGLSRPTWRDPYRVEGGAPACAMPKMTVISDSYTSYDSGLPGNAFGETVPEQILGFNAASEGTRIWGNHFGVGNQTVFVGESGTDTSGTPTAKQASSFGNIRGLSPEEPNKKGSYYAASVSSFGARTDLRPGLAGTQSAQTYAVALASPKPDIAFPLGGRTIRIVPFGKTVNGCQTNTNSANQPVNQIVDFYVETIANFNGDDGSGINGGRPYAEFRVNYEDIEQGNDHDMDAIVRYVVTATGSNSLTVGIKHEYGATCAVEHIGYTISGTTQDGLYLDIQSGSVTTRSDNRNPLNTPPGRAPGYCALPGNIGTLACRILPINTTANAVSGDKDATPRQFTVGTSAAGIALQNPLWYAAKYGGYKDANSNGLPDDGEWDKNQSGQPDNYFLVTNPLHLQSQLSKAFDDIAQADLKVGVATISGARVSSNSFTLQPTYTRERNGKDWFGNLSAVAVNPNGTLGATLWSAQSQLPLPVDRKILTIKAPGAGTNTTITAAAFDAASIGYANLGINSATVSTRYGAAYTAADFVNYLRGVRSREASNGGAANTLRTRSAVLGDIVNSEPIIASPRSNYGYGSYTADMFYGYTGASGYVATKSTRKTVAYVGANDGMLHAFDASTEPCASPNGNLTCAKTGAGKELFAFIPHGVLDQMGKLALPDKEFDHQYYVDGQMTVGDARAEDSTWKTLLVGSAGAGGRSIFALDVSNPEGFGIDQVLWERNAKVDLDIGNIYGKPMLVPLENDKWGVLFGNGYGGNNSDPSLYILDAFTGGVIRKITANDGNQASSSGLSLVNFICDFLSTVPPINQMCARRADPFNGLGQITAIDRNGNGKVDTVYGGDLQGNLWKFDLSKSAHSDWTVANSGAALFTALTGAGASTERQPITGGIRVAAGPGGGVMVYFGTGRYFVTGDNDVPTSPQVQSLYGIFDNGTAVGGGRTDLQVQTIDSETTAGGFTTRDLSRSPVSYYGTAPKRGWYLDLKLKASANGSGERFIATPLIQSGRVFFATYQPTQNSCDPGGINFQYGLDLLSGAGALANVQVLPTGTPACTGPNCGGVAIGGNGAGSAAQPPVMGTGVAAINPLTKINPTCDPATESCATFEQCQVVIYPGGFVLPRPCGRQSWRQLK